MPHFPTSARYLVEITGFIANLLAWLLVALVGWRLWGMSQNALLLAGGLPSLSIDDLLQLLTSEGALERILLLFQAWATAVGAIGCALLTVAGARAVTLRVSRYLIV